MSELVQVGRLALRSEGDWWNAYYAHEDTMQDAILLASVRLTAAQENADIKEAFMALARSLVDHAAQSTLGISPSWGGPQRAPEHERAGRA